MDEFLENLSILSNNRLRSNYTLDAVGNQKPLSEEKGLSSGSAGFLKHGLCKEGDTASNKAGGRISGFPKGLEGPRLLSLKLHPAQGGGLGPHTGFPQCCTLDQIQENGWIIFPSPISASK